MRNKQVSMQAVDAQNPNATVWANDVDVVLCINDKTWGGYVLGVETRVDRTLNPTSQAIVGISELVVGIGGGDIAYAELFESANTGNEVYQPTLVAVLLNCVCCSDPV